MKGGSPHPGVFQQLDQEKISKELEMQAQADESDLCGTPRLSYQFEYDLSAL